MGFPERRNNYRPCQAIFDVLAWSMSCLNEKRAPGARHDNAPWTPEDRKNRLPSGTPLPSAALLQIRGDWEWITQAFRFRTWSGEVFCWKCDASKSGAMSFKDTGGDQRTPHPLGGPGHPTSAELHLTAPQDTRPDAPHRATLIDHRRYMTTCARSRVAPSNIFRCPGTVLEHIGIDSMHTGDLGFKVNRWV